MTMFCGIDNISHSIPGYSLTQIDYGNIIIFYGILSIPQNIVMDLDNVMWLASQSCMTPPNLSISGTKIKRVKARWIALRIMEDGGCSLIHVKVTNPNIIKVAAKSPCITHPLN